MTEKVALTNVSFEFLYHSSEFLRTLLNNISSCVLLLDRNMELQAFNEPMRTIFSNKSEEHLLYKKCGNAIGCAYQVESELDCGETHMCSYCKLRESALKSYMEKRPVYKQRLTREFYTTESVKELKHLQFSTRPFYFQNDAYIMVLVDDVTPFVKMKEEEFLAESYLTKE